MKKILSIVLALCMCLPMLTFSSFAAPTEPIIKKAEFSLSVGKVVKSGRNYIIVPDDTVKSLSYGEEFNLLISVTNNDDFMINGVLDVWFTAGDFEFVPLVEPVFDNQGNLISGHEEFGLEKGAYGLAAGMLQENAFLVPDGDLVVAWASAYPFKTVGGLYSFRLKCITKEKKDLTFTTTFGECSDQQGNVFKVNSPTLTLSLNPNATTHTHTWEAVSSTTTCTKLGSTTYRCTGAGTCDLANTKTEADTVLNPNAHVWGTEIFTVASTCTTAGHTYKKCTENAEHTQKVADLAINPDAHNWGTPVTVAAGCTKTGSTTTTCTYNPAHTNVVSLPARGHNYKETYIPATTTAAGSYTKVCLYADCDDRSAEINKTIPMKTELAPATVPNTECIANADATSAEVTIASGINTRNVKTAGFIVAGKSGINTLELAKANNDVNCRVINVTKAYGIFNDKTADSAFGTGFTIAVRLTGFPMGARAKTLYVTSFVELWDGTVAYTDLGSFTVDSLIK